MYYLFKIGVIMIQVKDLTFSYDKKTNAIENINFSIEKGEIFGFLGPSGAGKSTVQNIMTGILKIQKGDVLYNNKSLSLLGNDFYNIIGVSFENPNLYTKLTGYENLEYYAKLFSVKTQKPMDLLTKVLLKDDAHKRVSEYSKGMKQRLVFARSLINNPEILFLDEPLSGLDPNTAAIIKDIIKQKKEEGTTIFLTTHNMFVADELCNRVAFLNEGKIIKIDSPQNLKLEYSEKTIKIIYEENNSLYEENFSIEKDKEKIKSYIDNKNIKTIHTKEATLEEIFRKLTGRGLY